MCITVLLLSRRLQPQQRQKYQSLVSSPLTKTRLISVAWSDAPGTHVTMYTHTPIHSATFKLNQVWAQAARFKPVSANPLCWPACWGEVGAMQAAVPTAPLSDYFQTQVSKARFASMVCLYKTSHKGSLDEFAPLRVTAPGIKQ